VEDSPAANAGLDPGDVLTEVEGKRAINLNRFHGIVGTYPQGTTVRMLGKRWYKERKEWEELKVSVFLGDPTRVRAADTALGRFDLGFTPSFDYPDLGVELEAVEEKGAAAEAGLRAGDVLVALEGTRIKGIQDLKEALARRKGGEQVKLTILRDGERMEKDLALRERPPEEGAPKEGLPPKD